MREILLFEDTLLLVALRELLDLREDIDNVILRERRIPPLILLVGSSSSFSFSWGIDTVILREVLSAALDL